MKIHALRTVALLTAAASVAAAPLQPEDDAGINVLRNIPYQGCRAEQKMDIYLPESDGTVRRPAPASHSW